MNHGFTTKFEVLMIFRFIYMYYQCDLVVTYIKQESVYMSEGTIKQL